MNRSISGWAMLAGLVACGVCGVAVMQHRRTSKMRRMMRKAGKTLSSMSAAILHIFS